MVGVCCRELNFSASALSFDINSVYRGSLSALVFFIGVDAPNNTEPAKAAPTKHLTTLLIAKIFISYCFIVIPNSIAKIRLFFDSRKKFSLTHFLQQLLHQHLHLGEGNQFIRSNCYL